METLIAILIIVFAVLQLVLFFKLWIATDDIRKIREMVAGKPNPMSPDLLKDVDEELFLGNKGKAVEILKRAQYELEYSLKKTDNAYKSADMNVRLDVIKAQLKKLSE